jgi:branched-chain amino acid transport system substrate-binding protein
MVNGHVLATDEINAAGGIKSLGGAKLVNVMGDTQGKPEIGLSQLQRLIGQEQTPVVMGAFQSAVTFATTQLAEEKQVPYVVPIGAADNITERGFKYTFKISPKGSRAATDMLDLIRDLGNKTGREAKTVGLVFVDNLFGQNQADSLRKLLPQYGLSLVADLSYPETTSDVSGVVAKLKAANPDVVLQSSYTQDGMLLSRAMADQDYAPTLAWMGFGGNAGDPQFFDAVGKQAENYFTEGFWLSSLPVPGVKEEAAAFQQRFNMEMDEYSAPAYTATYALADALERAGSADPQKLREALSSTNMNVGTKGNLFSFPITFPPDGQTPSHFIFVQNQNGKRVVVWPEDAAGGNHPMWPGLLGTKTS